MSATTASSIAGALAFVLCGLVPLAIQAISVFGGGASRLRAFVAKFERQYSMLQLQVNWGMFTNSGETGFLTVTKWGVRLRRAGAIVAERDLDADVSLVKFLERQRFDDRAVATSVMAYLLDHVADVDLDFDQFELVRHSKDRPRVPTRWCERFAHREFVAREYSSEVIASCRVGAP